MKSRIVYATPADIDQLVPLFDAYRLEFDQPSNLEEARTFILERLENAESVVFLALDDIGRGLGFVQLFPSFSSVSMQRIWIINDLYVAPYARRRGLAAALLENALQHAEESGAKELQLSIGVENLAAQTLYEKLGYVRDEDFHHYFLAVVSREEQSD